MHAAGFGSYSQSVLNRDEKLPAVRLAFIQYAIAVILAVLVFGLWRLQVVGGQNYHALAEANRIRKVPILAPAANSSTAKAASSSTTIPPSPASSSASRATTSPPICLSSRAACT